MKAGEELKKFITERGWTYTGSCRCGGMPTNKFEITTLQGEFKLRARASSFLISKPGKRFTRFPISEIKNMVDEVSKTVSQSDSA